MISKDCKSWVVLAAAVAADNTSGKQAAGADFIFCGVGENINDIWALFNIPKMDETESSDGAKLTVVFMLVKPAHTMSGGSQRCRVAKNKAGENRQSGGSCTHTIWRQSQVRRQQLLLQRWRKGLCHCNAQH